MAFIISSTEKDSIATTRDSFKDCILACKISNQMHTNFKKRKVPQAASGSFFQKWLFCKTYVLYNICFFICGQNSWKTRSKKYSIGLFQGKFTLTWKICWMAISVAGPLHQIFWSNKPICSNKIYERKLKPGDRLWALEIAYWKLSLYGQLFCIRQTSVLYWYIPLKNFI